MNNAALKDDDNDDDNDYDDDNGGKIDDYNDNKVRILWLI